MDVRHPYIQIHTWNTHPHTERERDSNNGSPMQSPNTNAPNRPSPIAEPDEHHHQPITAQYSGKSRSDLTMTVSVCVRARGNSLTATCGTQGEKQQAEYMLYRERE